LRGAQKFHSRTTANPIRIAACHEFTVAARIIAFAGGVVAIVRAGGTSSPIVRTSACAFTCRTTSKHNVTTGSFGCPSLASNDEVCAVPARMTWPAERKSVIVTQINAVVRRKQ
jgi:hypothetical protein